MVLYVSPVGDELIDLTDGAYSPVLSVVGHLICELEGSDHPLGIICHPGIRVEARERRLWARERGPQRALAFIQRDWGYVIARATVLL